MTQKRRAGASASTRWDYVPPATNAPVTRAERGTIWDGIRDAHNIHEAFELLEGLRRSGGRYLTELGEMALMVAALALVCAVFWLLG